MVSTGWSGHLGKVAPAVMTISAPQQRLLYTPNFSFTWPLCGTVRDAPKSHASLRLYASTRRTDTDKNAFSIAHRWGLIATAVNCRCYLPEIPHPLRLHEAKRASQCCHAGT